MRFVPLEKNHWEWLHDRTNIVYIADVKGLAVESEGRIIAVCACDRWSKTSVYVHVAIDSPIVLKHGRLMKEVFDYIFNQSNREIAIGLVDSRNIKALRFNKRIGFIEECRVKDCYGEGIDMIILTMRKDDCRWINHGIR